LSQSDEGEANEDPSFNENSGESNLIRDETGAMVADAID